MSAVETRLLPYRSSLSLRWHALESWGGEPVCQSRGPQSWWAAWSPGAAPRHPLQAGREAALPQRRDTGGERGACPPSRINCHSLISFFNLQHISLFFNVHCGSQAPKRSRDYFYEITLKPISLNWLFYPKSPKISFKNYEDTKKEQQKSTFPLLKLCHFKCLRISLNWDESFVFPLTWNWQNVCQF